MIDIDFTYTVCSDANNRLYYLFLFYPERVWDDEKLTIEEALQKYPTDKYNWRYFNA